MTEPSTGIPEGLRKDGKVPSANHPGARKRELRGVHVLMGFVGFFGVVFAVNGVFLYWALTTHTGVVSQQPYRKGLAYNIRIEADEKQRQLGWVPEISLERNTGRLAVTFKDKAGAPVSGLRIGGMIGRPSTVQHDAKIALLETAPGLYAAELGKRADGAWLVDLEAGRGGRGDDEIVYRLRRRLWLKP